MGWNSIYKITLSLHLEMDIILIFSMQTLKEQKKYI